MYSLRSNTSLIVCANSWVTLTHILRIIETKMVFLSTKWSIQRRMKHIRFKNTLIYPFMNHTPILSPTWSFNCDKYCENKWFHICHDNIYTRYTPLTYNHNFSFANIILHWKLFNPVSINRNKTNIKTDISLSLHKWSLTPLLLRTIANLHSKCLTRILSNFFFSFIFLFSY